MSPTPVLFTAGGKHMRATTHRQFPSAGFPKDKDFLSGLSVWLQLGKQVSFLLLLWSRFIRNQAWVCQTPPPHHRGPASSTENDRKGCQDFYNVSRKTCTQVITSYNCCNSVILSIWQLWPVIWQLWPVMKSYEKLLKAVITSYVQWFW